MTNQEAFEAARSGDWIAESFSRSGDVFTLGGKSAGYSSFADCLDDGQSIFYAAFDEDDNREAGLAIWDAGAKTLTPVEIHATLVGGAFIKGDPDPLQFTKGGTITGTFNATGFNTIWRHVFEKGNPHETQADEIDQSNAKLGDTVQEALNKIATYVVQLDPDGNTDIDWGDLDGLKDLLDSKAEQSALDQEILDRIAGDAALQAQIDAIDPDGDSDVDWSDIENKPTEFSPSAHQQGWVTITGKPSDYPPSSHGHDIDDVDGLQDALDAAGGTPAWDDVTGKPSEYPPEAHTHEQSEVDGLELRLEAIEGSITDGGGFVDAPDDGKLYGRQSEAWAEVVVPDAGASSWNDLTDKPTEFPPASHNHDGVYQPAGDYIGEAPNDGEEYARKSQGWVKLQDHNYTGADAVKLTGDQSVAGHKTWTGVSTFGDTVTMRGTLNGDDTANFQNAVTAGSFVKTGGTSAEYLMADGSVSAGPEAGGSVQVGPSFEGTPSEGDQWLETPAGGEAVMWVYDGEKWLQMPGAGGGSVTVTTSDVQLDQPTLRMPSGATTQADANSYFATALQNVVDEDGNSLVDLSEYYTSTEADANFQPKGDYIEDAPSDGELYVRKDGKWELYTPSSGGGGGGYMVPITPPQTAGEFQFGVKSNGGSGVFKNDMGSWYCQKSSTTATLTVPAGYKFVLQNFISNGASKDVMLNGIYLDDQQINTSSDTSNQYKKTEIMGVHDYDKRNLWPAAQNFIIERKAKFTLGSSGDNWFHVFGYFIPSDNTRESAELREAYLAEEAERIAAMPVTTDLPEEGDE